MSQNQEKLESNDNNLLNEEGVPTEENPNLKRERTHKSETKVKEKQ